jgi:hypothetical protein
MTRTWYDLTAVVVFTLIGLAAGCASDQVSTPPPSTASPSAPASSPGGTDRGDWPPTTVVTSAAPDTTGAASPDATGAPGPSPTAAGPPAVSGPGSGRDHLMVACEVWAQAATEGPETRTLTLMRAVGEAKAAAAADRELQPLADGMEFMVSLPPTGNTDENFAKARTAEALVVQVCGSAGVNVP